MQLNESQTRSDASRWDDAFNTGEIDGLARFYAEGLWSSLRGARQ
jgi:hypothetical protein